MKGLGKDNNGNLRNNIQIFIQYIECVCWISYDRVISCKQKNKMGKKVYQKFLKLYQDTTTIMITHRLGATSLCDWIIAIEDGKAMEQGSHEDLMAKNGIYCEMYETQRRWYL